MEKIEILIPLLIVYAAAVVGMGIIRSAAKESWKVYLLYEVCVCTVFTLFILSYYKVI